MELLNWENDKELFLRIFQKIIVLFALRQKFSDFFTEVLTTSPLFHVLYVKMSKLDEIGNKGEMGEAVYYEWLIRKRQHG